MKRRRKPVRRLAVEPGIEFLPATKNYRVSLHRSGKYLPARTLPDLEAARAYRAELEATHPRKAPGGCKTKPKAA